MRHEVQCVKSGFIKRNIWQLRTGTWRAGLLVPIGITIRIYACVVGDPYQIKDISNLEKLQKRQQTRVFK